MKNQRFLNQDLWKKLEFLFELLYDSNKKNDRTHEMKTMIPFVD